MDKIGGRGKHTTINDSASKVVRIAEGILGVKRVIVGPLYMGQGKKKPVVKISEQGGCILLLCFQTMSKQELRLYIEDGMGSSVIGSLKQALGKNGLSCS